MSNTTHSLKNKTDVVQYVSEQLKVLKPGSTLTMIIDQDMLEGFFVITATDASSEDIVKTLGQHYYDKLTNIS